MLNFFCHAGAVQALVEQQVSPVLDLLPRRELSLGHAVLLGFRSIVRVVPRLGRTDVAIGFERRLQFGEQVRFLAEMAEVGIALVRRLFYRAQHLLAVVAMECVALDVGRLDVLAPEYGLERAPDRRGAGARRAGDRDDRMLAGHAFGLLRPRVSRGTLAGFAHLSIVRSGKGHAVQIRVNARPPSAARPGGGQSIRPPCATLQSAACAGATRRG